MSTFKLAEKFGLNFPLAEEQSSSGFLKEHRLDYDKLIKELKGAKNSGLLRDFNYNRYLSTTRKSIEIVDRETDEVHTARPLVDIPLYVTNENGESRSLKLNAILNTKKANVRTDQNVVRMNINYRKRYVEYHLVFIYEGYDKRTNSTNLSDVNRVAIDIMTRNYDDYIALGKYLGYKEKQIEDFVFKKFDEAFKNITEEPSKLKLLYEKAPLPILKRIGDSALIDDLFKLVTYDKDSWFKDASSAILKLLTGFNDLKVLYKYFHDNPEKIIQTYDVLGDYFKQEFAKLLDAVSIPLTKVPGKRLTKAKFTIGKGYKLNSNLFLEDNQKEIFLEVSKKYTKSRERTTHDSFGVPYQEIVTSTENISVKQQTIFHPLDLVVMVDEATGTERIVTAMHVKTLSDKAEWDQVISTVVKVTSIIAVLVSAGALAAGATGVVAFIAVTEIIVGSLDLLKELLKSSDKEYSGSIKWFIENWDAVSGTYGLASITALVRSGILKHGPRVLAKIRNLPKSERVVSLRKGIDDLLFKIEFEFYFIKRLGFTYFKMLPYADVARLLGVGGQRIVKNMQKFGLLIAAPVSEVSDIRILVYFGVKIAEGKIKNLKETLRKIFKFKAKDEDVLKYLNNLYEIGKLARSGSGGFLKYTKVLSRNMFKQEEWMSCAAACLRKYADDLGIKITESEIRVLAKTSETGTDGKDLYYAMVKIFKDKEVFAKTYFESLDEFKNFDAMLLDSGGKSFITNVGFPPNKHTIIVDKIVGEKVHIKDPWPLEVDDAFEQGIRGNQLEKVFDNSISGVEAIIDLDHFKNLWIQGGNIMFKIR